MPSFNHDRADGFYCPCDICWKEMGEKAKIYSILGRLPVSSSRKAQRTIKACRQAGEPLDGVLDAMRADLERKGLK